MILHDKDLYEISKLKNCGYPQHHFQYLLYMILKLNEQILIDSFIQERQKNCRSNFHKGEIPNLGLFYGIFLYHHYAAMYVTKGPSFIYRSKQDYRVT